ncbi:MAG: hypothetical protein ACOYYF_07935 [Chloroflexota bacterium]|nr:hypothetical protein [Chloroflexota bacterium]MBI5704854.1 hypothetical protein [Chloroflexota bacterium]
MAEKIDGIIEAVRFKNGQIVLARVYERRGASFSDCILIERKDLLERIKSGKKFVTGSRKEFWGGTFEVGKPVRVVTHDGKEFLSTREGAERDELENVPVF